MRLPRTTLISLGAAAALAAGGTGAALAVTGGDDRDDAPLTGATAEQAREAAQRIAGGGTVTDLERDREHGGAYEAEVRRPDGSEVDVRLDERFEVVGRPEVEARDDDRFDRDDAGDRRDDDRDDRLGRDDDADDRDDRLGRDDDADDRDDADDD